MSIRKVPFVNGEFYHIYNRGVEKRNIFNTTHDISRFFMSMQEFNVVEPIGSIYELKFASKQMGGRKLGGEASKSGKLVNLIAYCLNPNHYHFLLEQVADKGIEKFMHRIGTGYTRYFNDRNKRSGSLFQGVFKSVYIDSNEYLLHLSAYINLNNHVHQLGGEASKLSRSSWEEYLEKIPATVHFCEKDIIMGQFRNTKEYKEFAEDSLQSILEKRYTPDNLGDFLLE